MKHRIVTLIALALIILVSCSASVPQPGAEWVYDGGSMNFRVERFRDEQAGMICYVAINGGGGNIGISCIPIQQTFLEHD